MSCLKKKASILSNRFVLIAFSFFSAACNEPTSNPFTKVQLLASNGSWTMKDYLVTKSNGSILQKLSDLDACQQDDVWIFVADGTLTVTEGVTECSPPKPSQNNFWLFNLDETRLFISDAGSLQGVRWKIEELSLIRLRISKEDFFADPTPEIRTTTLTFSKE